VKVLPTSATIVLANFDVLSTDIFFAIVGRDIRQGAALSTHVCTDAAFICNAVQQALLYNDCRKRRFRLPAVLPGVASIMTAVPARLTVLLRHHSRRVFVTSAGRYAYLQHYITAFERMDGARLVVDCGHGHLYHHHASPRSALYGGYRIADRHLQSPTLHRPIHLNLSQCFAIRER
jgi:hypothetical protein